jgi:energy-coupling factor transporter transmembrane protein EcfT
MRGRPNEVRAPAIGSYSYGLCVMITYCFFRNQFYLYMLRILVILIAFVIGGYFISWIGSNVLFAIILTGLVIYALTNHQENAYRNSTKR